MQTDRQPTHLYYLPPPLVCLYSPSSSLSCLILSFIAPQPLPVWLTDHPALSLSLFLFFPYSSKQCYRSGAPQWDRLLFTAVLFMSCLEGRKRQGGVLTCEKILTMHFTGSSLGVRTAGLENVSAVKMIHCCSLESHFSNLKNEHLPCNESQMGTKQCVLCVFHRTVVPQCRSLSLSSKENLRQRITVQR